MTWKLLDQILPIPADRKFRRIPIVGPSGAGKSTLVRAVLHIDPKKSYPSTSVSKTTTSETEFVVCDGPYQAAATFFDHMTIKDQVTAVVLDAALKYVNGSNDDSLRDALTESSDQRFRLKYVLGDYPLSRAQRSGHWLKIIPDAIKGLVNEIRALEPNETDLEKLSQLVSEFDTCFEPVVQQIMDMLVDRVKSFTAVEIEFDQLGWPKACKKKFQSEDDLFDALKLLTGNHHTNYGYLLTPFVDKMRVIGPFYDQDLHESAPAYIIYDGQGVGHDGEFSLSKNLARQLQEAGKIVIVESSIGQSGSIAAQKLIEHLVNNGLQDRLVYVFTRFDQMKDDPCFATVLDKKKHLVRNVLSIIPPLSLKSSVAVRLGQIIEENSVVLPELDQGVFRDDGVHLELLKGELQVLHYHFQNNTSSIHVKCKSEPVFEWRLLSDVFLDANQKLLQMWKDRLYGHSANYAKPYYPSLKAFACRAWKQADVEWKDLRPCSDFTVIYLQELRKFLDNPKLWLPNEPEDEAADELINWVMRELAPFVREMIEEEFIFTKQQFWFTVVKDPYFRGSGAYYRVSNSILNHIKECFPPKSTALQHESDEEKMMHFRSNLEKIKLKIQEAIGAYRIQSPLH